MQLGTQTNSVVNHIQSRRVQPWAPEIGSGATLLAWTDRYPGTVIEFDAQRRIVTVQEDHAQRTDDNGMSESQTYDYTPNPEGAIHHFKRIDKGEHPIWREVYFNEETNRWRRYDGGRGINFGTRDKYHDFSF